MGLVASGMGGLVDLGAALLVILLGAISAVGAAALGFWALRSPVSWRGVRATYLVLAAPYVLTVFFSGKLRPLAQAGELAVWLVTEDNDVWGWGLLAWLNPAVALAITACVVRLLILGRCRPAAPGAT